MATFDAPAFLLAFGQFEFGIQKAGTQFRGPFNGTLQAVEFVAERWVVSVGVKLRDRAHSGEVEAFMARLAGGLNRVRLPHMASGNWPAQYTPRGTMRGAPTLSAAIVRGALQLSLSTGQPGCTLLAGDMLGCNQLFMVADDCTANGSGLIVVPLVNRVRAATASGTLVVWNKPTADFVMPAMVSRHSHLPNVMQAQQYDLEEVW